MEFFRHGDVVVHVFGQFHAAQRDDIFVSHRVFKIVAEEQNIVQIGKLMTEKKLGTGRPVFPEHFPRLTYIDTP